jgi:hypothetical protein
MAQQSRPVEEKARAVLKSVAVGTAACAEKSTKTVRAAASVPASALVSAILSASAFGSSSSSSPADRVR